MIYKVKVQIDREGIVFIEAKTKDQAVSTALSSVVLSRVKFVDTVHVFAENRKSTNIAIDESKVEIIKAEDVL